MTRASHLKKFYKIYNQAKSSTPSSSTEPPHCGIQRAPAKSSQLALPGKVVTSTTAQLKRVTKAKARKVRPATRTTTANGRSSSLTANLDNVHEDNALSDHASLSSIEEMIESDPKPDESSSPQNTGFSQSQRAAIRAIVETIVTAPQ